MARSIDPAPRAVRGFVPARTDEERFLMRHVEDLARAAEGRGIARYSGFLSDREQDLARAALNRADVPESDHHFEGGWPGAERKLLCLEPEGCYPASPLCCVKLTCRTLSGAVLPGHKDYLGSLMGLELRREALCCWSCRTGWRPTRRPMPMPSCSSSTLRCRISPGQQSGTTRILSPS